uniref:Uncharacterized protein n=1 Tax=Anguilla anguilla TaxID=7936 RepID=A0A0E9S5X0_ANGAN
MKLTIWLARDICGTTFKCNARVREGTPPAYNACSPRNPPMLWQCRCAA